MDEGQCKGRFHKEKTYERVYIVQKIVDLKVTIGRGRSRGPVYGDVSELKDVRKFVS